MYFEINVAKKSKIDGAYRHYFATAERSISTETELKGMLIHFKHLFPEPEFNIIATGYEKIGHPVDINELLDINESEK
jgi:hypothetical protein